MRKSGCPFTVRDYSIQIENKVTGEAVPVKGLSEMRVDVEAETEDGKAGDALWSEMFVKSRGLSGSLSGRPICDRATGVRDPGQALLHRAAHSGGGCDCDQTLIIADAIGRAVKYDCVITKETASADEDGETVAWEFEGVGAPEELAYVQASKIAFVEGESASMTVGETKEFHVQFTPETASNRRFSYSIADESVATLNAIDGPRLSIRAAGEGETELTVKSMNNNLTATLTITVSAAE